MILSSGLQFAYANGARLHFPDVDLPQGGVLLLGGPSGSGKSTWLALAAGLVAPSGGSLQVAGQMLGALGALKTDAWRAQTIGFLPQKLHLSAALTVHHNLALAFWAAGVAQDKARIHAALDALGVADLAQRLPSQLSGGQAQRVALARAVLMRPRVLLADEPTASLDDHNAADAVHLLWATAQSLGATLVIATHDARVGHTLHSLVPVGAAPGVQRLVLGRIPADKVAP
jgi:putative ABC transport system ATP-binding protein